MSSAMSLFIKYQQIVTNWKTSVSLFYFYVTLILFHTIFLTYQKRWWNINLNIIYLRNVIFLLCSNGIRNHWNISYITLQKSLVLFILSSINIHSNNLILFRICWFDCIEMHNRNKLFDVWLIYAVDGLIVML